MEPATAVGRVWRSRPHPSIKYEPRGANSGPHNQGVSVSDPFRAEYARVQHLVEIGKVRDEQLDALLKRHARDVRPFDLHDSRRQLKNLDRNLARKDRHRVDILKRNAAHIGSVPVENPLTAAIRHEQCATVRQAAGDDWELLRAMADGGFDEVAAQLGVPVGTIKSRVSRARSRLRSSLGGVA